MRIIIGRWFLMTGTLPVLAEPVAFDKPPPKPRKPRAVTTALQLPL